MNITYKKTVKASKELQQIVHEGLDDALEYIVKAHRAEMEGMLEIMWRKVGDNLDVIWRYVGNNLEVCWR